MRITILLTAAIMICSCAAVVQSGGRTYNIRPENSTLMGYPVQCEYNPSNQNMKVYFPGEICNRKGDCGSLNKAYLVLDTPSLKAPLAYTPLTGKTSGFELSMKIASPEEAQVVIHAEYFYKGLGERAVDVMTFRPSDFI